MKIEQITSAGMPQIPSSSQRTFTGTEGRVENLPPQEVFVQIGGNQIKIGEYPGGSEIKVEESVENMNRELKSMETNLRFSIHKKTKQIMVKIIDSNTNEVIKEIPPEKIVDMVAAMMERAGLLLDKRG